MVQTTKEIREVFAEALDIGVANEKERVRHRRATDRLMVRAAENVYAAHLVEAVHADGLVPANGEAACEAARKGVPLTAKGYAMVLGFSEAYVSRLYRLGFALAAGVVDPNERSRDGEPTRWQLLSRAVGDTPEVGAVLGKDVDTLPTEEALDEAIQTAQTRRAQEREDKRNALPPPEWLPDKPNERIERLEELTEVVIHQPRLTPKQIDRLRQVMDELRETIEEWLATHAA